MSGGGEREKGGHVLRDTTSRGLYVRVWPPHTRAAAAHLWYFGGFRFPPVLVRTGRRLPVQALGERGVLVSVTGYPRGGAPGPG